MKELTVEERLATCKEMISEFMGWKVVKVGSESKEFFFDEIGPGMQGIFRSTEIINSLIPVWEKILTNSSNYLSLSSLTAVIFQETHNFIEYDKVSLEDSILFVTCLKIAELGSDMPWEQY